MTLQEVQTLNNLRSADINSLLGELHTKLEGIFVELESEMVVLQSLRDEVQSLNQEKEESLQAINVLKIDNEKVITEHTSEVTTLQEQSEKLKKLIEATQSEYETLINNKNKAFEEITLEKNELKVRELSLKSKVEAFRKEREEFNFEKRKFEAEKSDYSGII